MNTFFVEILTFEKHCKGENWILGISPFNGFWTQQWSWILSQRFMCRTWNKNKIDFRRFFKAIISELKHITPERMSLVTVTLCLVWMWSNISHCLSQFWFHIILTFKGNQNTCPSFWVVRYHHSVCAPAPHTNRNGCRSSRKKQSPSGPSSKQGYVCTSSV